MPDPIFMKLGTYVMSPEAISTAPISNGDVAVYQTVAVIALILLGMPEHIDGVLHKSVPSSVMPTLKLYFSCFIAHTVTCIPNS
jgi:hypothetical protein